MIKKAQGFYPTFERKDGGRSTHYCAGCGHGIIQKLIAEAMAEMGMQDDAVFVSPVGCAAFCYYYLDCGNVAAPHGRASAVATGLSRVLPDKYVIAYQGDGDLGAIGFNNAFQAANRGEHFALFFVNNALYAMTGGQMAPTSLPDQKTTTSPRGRDITQMGSPLKVCEIFDQLDAPRFIERVSVADTKRIMQAKKAIRRALEIQKEGKGFAFVEILSPCPTNMHTDAVKAAEFVTEQMEAVFPLQRFRDLDEPMHSHYPPMHLPVQELIVPDEGGKDAVHDPEFPEWRMKFSGFGGQGVLSLGLVIAKAASSSGRFVSWFPSYGPEQRGGSASCAVVLAGKEVGSPVIDNPHVLVAMNQPSLERFLPTVAAGGVALYDRSIQSDAVAPEGVRTIAFPAKDLAIECGVPKAANTAFLGALHGLGMVKVDEEALLLALDESFANKPKLVEMNRKVFLTARSWVEDNV